MGRGEAMFAVAAEGEVAPAPLTREARRANLGVDCAELLEWRQWDAGGEYVKDLLVKNVGGKSIKLKYRLPATKYFSMEFPEPIRLSPGMSCTVPVTFRPVRNERYDDVIEFSVGSHGDRFVVPVRAVLPPEVEVEVARERVIGRDRGDTAAATAAVDVDGC